MPLYKVTFDNGPSGIMYITKHATIQILDGGRTNTQQFKTRKSNWIVKELACIGSVDKVVEPERKMFWLVFGPTLRTMGVIK